MFSPFYDFPEKNKQKLIHAAQSLNTWLWLSVSVAQFNLIIMFSFLPAAFPVCHPWTCHLCRSRTYDMWMPGMAGFPTTGGMGLPRICPCFSVSGDSAPSLLLSTDPLFTPGALQALWKPLCLGIVWQVSIYLTWQPDMASVPWKLAGWAQDHSWAQDSCRVHMWAGSTPPEVQLSHDINTSSPQPRQGHVRPQPCWGQIRPQAHQGRARPQPHQGQQATATPRPGPSHSHA